jgi:O-antigen ligase
MEIAKNLRPKVYVSEGVHASIGISILLMLFVLTTIWGFILIYQDEVLNSLSEVNVSIRMNKDKPWALICFGMLGSYTIGIASIWLLTRNTALFLAAWIMSLALAEASIPIVHQIMLIIRYPFMLALISFGTIEYFKNIRKHSDIVQKIGAFIALLILLHSAIDGIDLTSGLLIPMQLALFFGVFYGLPTLINNNKMLSKITLGFAVVGIFVTLVNFIGCKFADGPILNGRLRSWYSLPTGFANNYVLLLTPIIWLLFATRKFGVKLISFIAILIGIYMLYASGTRNAMLALLIASGIICLFWQQKYLIYLILFGCILLLSMYAFDFDHDNTRLSHVSEKETRYRVWSLGWSYIIEKPFWGYGLGVDLTSLSGNLPVWERFDAHNAYLGIWLRIGLLGMLAYMLIYIISLRRGFNLIKQEADSEMKSIIVLYLALISELFISGMFEENLSSRGSIQQAIWAISTIVIFMRFYKIVLSTKINKTSPI